MHRILATCLVTALSGCAMQPKAPETSPLLLEALAAETSEYIASRVPVASTPILVDESDQPALTRAVTDSLLRRGFAVAVPGVETAGAQRVRVQSVDVSSDDVLLQVTFNAATASRLYAKQLNGSVQAVSAFTVADVSPRAGVLEVK